MDKLDHVKADSQKNNHNGIEDAELGAFDKLWGKDGIYDLIRSKSRMFQRADYPGFARAAVFAASKIQRFNVGDAPPSQKSKVYPEQEYDIDPITNRKVFKDKITHDERKPIQVPVKTFKGYRSQFDDFQPPAFKSSGNETKPIPSTNNTSSQSKHSDPTRDYLQDYESTETYKPFFSPETKPTGRFTVMKDGLKEFESQMSSQENVLSKEPVGTCPVQEGLEDYDSRTTYGISQESKPESKVLETDSPLDPVEQGLKDYDNKVTYGTMKDAKVNPNVHKNSSTDSGLKEFESKTSYGPVMHNKPEWETQLERGYGARRILKNISLNREDSKTDRSFRYQHDTDTREDLDLLRPSDIRAASGIMKGTKKESEVEKSSKREELERDFNKTFAEALEETCQSTQQLRVSKTSSSASDSGEAHKPTNAPSQPKNTTRKLTGYYGRDFPEEFEKSWVTSESGGLSPKSQADAWGYDKTPQGLELSYQQEVEQNVQKAEKEYIDGCAGREAFARTPETPRLQTSLDRGQKQENAASSPDQVQLKLSKENATQLSAARATFEQKKKDAILVTELRSIYEEKYGTIDPEHRQVPESSITNPATKPSNAVVESDNQEPTIYKILAYDPTMQSISTAETTSIVPDSATALTPAEVLLRLSNPAKFFPHFQPLQAEGYEIISGSGDVLIFRKVRSVGPPGTKSESSSSYQTRTRNTTNPIDGMQSRPVAATGNFASPTGFVNYDHPPMPAEPPFKSNIDVRREEPVFSGKSTWSEEGEKTKRKRPSLGKRVLVGGVMVGGLSYAIGVVAEFFRSGGVDGLGPQGF